MAARKDLLTNATDGRSFPDKKLKMSSSTSRFRLSAETMLQMNRFDDDESGQ